MTTVLVQRCFRVLCLLSLIVTAGSESCDTMWRQFGDSCYYSSNNIYANQNPKASWHEARAKCEEKGGDLVSIHSKEENNFTTYLVKSPTMDYMQRGKFIISPKLPPNFRPGVEEFWIGLNQLEDRKEFRWSDSSSVDFTSWSSSADQPTNQRGLCTITKSKVAVSVAQYPSINMVHNVTKNPNCLNCLVDPENTFYFAYLPDSDGVTKCEAACVSKPGCYSYTYFSMTHPSDKWRGGCFGATRTSNTTKKYDPYATSGIIVQQGFAGLWQPENCGVKAGYICKKKLGAPTPTPTQQPTTTLAPQPHSYCPEGYYGIGNKCLKVVMLNGSNQVNWTKALDICRSAPGKLPDLASISNIDEENLVSALLKADKSMHATDRLLFIGLYKLGDDWVWTDNSNLDYTSWNYGEPSTYYHVEELCAEYKIEDGSRGKWNNVECSKMGSYVCQTMKDTSSQPVATAAPFDCPPNYIAYWNACYRFDDTPVTWSEADQSCRKDGALLASVLSEAENSAMFYYANNKLPKWIGLSRSNSRRAFRWADGRPDRFNKWAPEQPSSTSDCVAIGNAQSLATSSSSSSSKKFTWSTYSCTAKNGFICKKSNDSTIQIPPSVNGTCPKDWVPWGDSCYKFPSQTDTPLTWNSANAKCAQLAGGDTEGTLVSIHSAAENYFISNTLADLMSDRDRNFRDNLWYVWIGLSMEAATDTWKWADSTALQFTEWAARSPSLVPQYSRSDRVCTRMLTEYTPGYWDDYYCSHTYPYVCETPKMPIPTEPSTPVPVQGSCPSSGWIKYGKDCFLFRPDDRVDWDTARKKCADESDNRGTLASIKDFGENWFVWKTMVSAAKYPTSANVYIGFYRKSTAHAFRWMDDSLANSVFTYWSRGRPSNFTENELCVEMSTTQGKWNDIACSSLRGYVCQVQVRVWTTERATTVDDSKEDTATSSRSSNSTISVTRALGQRGGQGDREGGRKARGVVIAVVLSIIVLVTVLMGAAWFRYRMRNGLSHNRLVEYPSRNSLSLTTEA